MKRKWTCLLGLMLAGGVLFGAAEAQAKESGKENYVVTVYNEQNGLPTGEANTVLQTQDGYIWIGSYGGLIRYDGTRFINFSQMDAGISSSSVRALFEDSKGRLWIGSNDVGVFLYENGKFVKIQGPGDYSFRSIRDFAEGEDGSIYVASSSGLGVITDGKLTPYTEEGIFGQNIYSIGVDAYGRIWAAMDYGKCFVVEDGDVVWEISSDMLFEGEEIYSVASGNKGEIYLGTSDNELAVLFFEEEGCSLDNVRVEYRNTGDVTTHNLLQVNRQGDVLVSGLHGMGIYTADGSFTSFGEDEKAVSVNWAEVDYEGNIWLATSGLGVVKYARAAFEVPKVDLLDGTVINTVQKTENRYYIGTDSGLLLFDANFKPVNNTLTTQLRDVRIRHILESSQGLVYIATYYGCGVICYDPVTQQITQFDSENGLLNNGVRVLLELSDGSIAAGTQEGICVLRDGKVAECYGREEGIDIPAILCLTEGSDGAIYAGSDGGGIYVVREGKVENYGFRAGLNEGVVLRMLEDEEGGFFVSAGSSLYYWKENTFSRLTNFEKGAGSIFDFYLRDGRLWLLQNSGLVAVEKDILLSGMEAEAETYGFALGLSGSLNANTWHDMEEDGSLILATRSGLSVFDFSDVESTLPKGVINEIQVDDIVYRQQEEITLPKDTARITFDFSMLSYCEAGNYKMSCYLEGGDEEEYVYGSEKNGRISYTNLAGGDYVFHLKVFEPGQEDAGCEYLVKIHKEKRMAEYFLFWVIGAVLIVAAVAGVLSFIFKTKMRRMQRRHKEYHDIINQSLETFAHTIDAKDADTNGHSVRVAVYVREIAARMGMSEEEQENVYYIALMHDIGKIGIPDSILKKQGELTDEEWEIVKKHPVIGGEILKDFTALDGIAEGARYHHERYDGSGYCEQISGKEIPLVARMIGVADTFDAMATTRCYREALGKEEILEELKKGSGTQFDPEILKIMLEMIEDGVVAINAQPKSG